MDYRNWTTDDLIDEKVAARETVRRLEKKGARRTTSDNVDLKRARATVREITKEMSKRFVQLSLL